MQVVRRIIIEAGVLHVLSGDVDGWIFHAVLGAGAVAGGADVLIGDANGGGVGQRDRGEIVGRRQRRRGGNGVAYRLQGGRGLANGACEVLAENVRAGLQLA